MVSDPEGLAGRRATSGTTTTSTRLLPILRRIPELVVLVLLLLLSLVVTSLASLGLLLLSPLLARGTLGTLHELLVVLVADILVSTTYAARDAAVSGELVVGAAAVVAALRIGSGHRAGRCQLRCSIANDRTYCNLGVYNWRFWTRVCLIDVVENFNSFDREVMVADAVEKDC